MIFFLIKNVLTCTKAWDLSLMQDPCSSSSSSKLVFKQSIVPSRPLEILSIFPSRPLEILTIVPSRPLEILSIVPSRPLEILSIVPSRPLEIL